MKSTAIVKAAHQHFSFIADSPASVDVRIGDGRLMLQDEASRRFDVLVVDAFSGDAIPVHLLTREAVMLYLQRIKQGGVIALHVSNSHLDLRPVVGRIAADLGLQVAASPMRVSKAMSAVTSDRPAVRSFSAAAHRRPRRAPATDEAWTTATSCR
jgi:spermidine synthase